MILTLENPFFLAAALAGRATGTLYDPIGILLAISCVAVGALPNSRIYWATPAPLISSGVTLLFIYQWWVHLGYDRDLTTHLAWLLTAHVTVAIAAYLVGKLLGAIARSVLPSAPVTAPQQPPAGGRAP